MTLQLLLAMLMLGSEPVLDGPISFDGCEVIELKSNLRAINSRAHVQILMNGSMPKGDWVTEFIYGSEQLDEEISKFAIRSTLYDADGKEYDYVKQSLSVSAGNLYLNLAGEEVSYWVAFVKLKLCTEKHLKDAEIFWVNGQL